MAASHRRFFSHQPIHRARRDTVRRAMTIVRSSARQSAAPAEREWFDRAMTALADCLAPKPVRHRLTHAEAAALAEAGVMPLRDYLELADRNGWVDTPSDATA